jgi:protein SCO1
MRARRWLWPAMLATVATVGAAVAFHVTRTDVFDAQSQVAMLDRSVLPIASAAPIDVPLLVAADGSTFDASRLRGHWTLLFFGFTSCPELCPMTLGNLARFARDPASGVEAGNTQVVFVTVDPEHDSPARIGEYLEGFDRRFVGVTGSHSAIRHFAAAASAGYLSSGESMDHSSSVFVVDPQGRLAGVLLHPSDPARIRADLGSLRG